MIYNAYPNNGRSHHPVPVRLSEFGHLRERHLRPSELAQKPDGGVNVVVQNVVLCIMKIDDMLLLTRRSRSGPSSGPLWPWGLR